MARVRRSVPHSTQNIRRRERKAKRRAKKKRQRRHQRRMKQIHIGRAARNPDAPPKARGCLAVHFWKRFKLSEHLVRVGILKEGLPLGHILLVVMLFGLLNATSLADVVQQVNKDRVLCAILDID